MSRYVAEMAGAVIVLWNSKRFDTCEIAFRLNMRECDVERVIHADREARRSAA